MILIDKLFIKNLSKQAQESERLRMNYNLHDSLDAPSQRLLNALEPGTQVPVHKHIHTAETYIILQGRLRVDFFNEEKMVTEFSILDPKLECYGVNIPAGQLHSVEVLESGTVIFECKDGPYIPIV